MFSKEEKNGREITISWEDICSIIKLRFHKRSTGVLVALCQFHLERHASLHFWPKSGRCHCFGCGWGGDKIDFFSMYFPEKSLEDILSLVENRSVLSLWVKDHPEFVFDIQSIYYLK